MVLNKFFLIFKFLLLIAPFNIVAQLPLSLSDIDLAEQTNYDNWIYEDETFFVVAVQLGEYTDLSEIQFNIKYNSDIVSPVSNNTLIELNQAGFLSNQNVDDFSLLNDGNLISEVFSNGSQNLLALSYSEGSFISENSFQEQNGTLLYLGFKKEDPCYEGPISFQFWDGLDEGVYLNPSHTSAVTINQTFSTDNNLVFSIDGSVSLNILSIELIQDGSSFSVAINDGIPPFTYNWTNKMDESLSVESSFFPSETADYLVYVSDSNQCVSSLYFSFEQGAFIDDYYIAKIGPNPFNNVIYLDFSLATDYVLMDMKGKIIRQSQNILSEILNTDDLSKGTYFLKISNSIQNKVIKLISI